MSLNDVVSAERVQVGFFGVRNAGKSSLVNAVAGQPLAVVSPMKGTTTDPVRKAMEILPLGPVVLIDTPGLDDEGELGELRVARSRAVLAAVDVAVLVLEAGREMLPVEQELLSKLRERGIPTLLAYNKVDLLPPEQRPPLPDGAVYVSAASGQGVRELRDRLGAIARGSERERHILADLVSPGDRVVLVVPIDAAAPKGRLILPQQQVLRELLDLHCAALVVQPEELPGAISGEPPALVITDSQAFERVARDVPSQIALTSFSILFARYKGELHELIAGAGALRRLRTGDRVIIAEGCTHHRQCGDIGSEKLPAWIRSYCGEEPVFSFCSGGDFPTAQELTGAALVLHCGGCMLTESEMKRRLATAREAGVPVVNYGVTIAQMKGILPRALAPLGVAFPGDEAEKHPGL